MIVKRRGAGYVRGVRACVTWRHGGDGGHGDDGGDDDVATVTTKKSCFCIRNCQKRIDSKPILR